MVFCDVYFWWIVDLKARLKHAIGLIMFFQAVKVIIRHTANRLEGLSPHGKTVSLEAECFEGNILRQSLVRVRKRLPWRTSRLHVDVTRGHDRGSRIFNECLLVESKRV